jgi:hypothetical protein
MYRYTYRPSNDAYRVLLSASDNAYRLLLLLLHVSTALREMWLSLGTLCSSEHRRVKTVVAALCSALASSYTVLQ